MFQSVLTISSIVTMDMDLLLVVDMIYTLPISVTQIQVAMLVSQVSITSKVNLSMLLTNNPIVYSVVQRADLPSE